VQRSFDYVVVGGGSAGCVMAARLSEDPSIKVLLLEAGGSDRSPLIQAPGGLLPIMLSGAYSWGYQSVPQRNLNDRVLHLPRGKVLGGSSSINGMVYCRGVPADYDGWAAAGNPGWSFAEVLPYFKRAETYEGGANPYHGGEGPIYVSRPGIRHPFAGAFVAAGAQAGHPYNDDTNAENREGFGPTDVTVRRGRRCSASVAYLRPALRRPNLQVITAASVTGIRFEGRRAVGVDYLIGGRPAGVRAGREVILSAGALNSPQLLMLSGIGDADHLAAHGIRTLVDLKGVGGNLQDHLSVTVQYTSKLPLSLFKYFNPLRAAGALAQYVLFRSGPLSDPGMEAVAFLKSSPTVPDADIKLHCLMALYSNHGKELVPEHGFGAYITAVRPDSRGSVRLQSADPGAAPLIDQNYLGAPRDLEVMRSGVRLAREVLNQKAFDAFRKEELQPGAAAVGDEEIDAFIRARAQADYHSAGTCKMGRDDGAVVDHELKVHGLEGLRVVDASVMPRLISGNTNMATIMIAEKAADLLRAVS